MVLIVKAKQRAVKNVHPFLFTLKMVTAMFVEKLDNFQHSTRLIPPKAEVVHCTEIIKWLACTSYDS
jgi:hypothetical protein